MEKTYQLPLMGTVKSKDPLEGDENDILAVIPIKELPGWGDLPEEVRGYSTQNLSFDIDRDTCKVLVNASPELHAWLGALKSQVKQIKQSKGWELKRADLT